MEYCDNELYHYGVKGMKWGRRMARGHGGPGVYATRKRQLAGDKRDLDALNKGEHLSYGVTKKRQAAYDARDRKALEKRISKNEKYLADKERKQNKKPMSTKKKVAIGMAATAAIVGGAYGAYRLNKVLKNKNIISTGKQVAQVAQVAVNTIPVNTIPVNRTPVNRTPVNRTPVNRTPVNRTPVNKSYADMNEEEGRNLRNQAVSYAFQNGYRPTGDNPQVEMLRMLNHLI